MEISSTSFYLDKINISISSSNYEESNKREITLDKNKSIANDSNNLSEEEKREIEKLKKTDREVKAHEAAHIAAGGQYVRGGATFSYEIGPDGKRYAVGGEVSIDTSSVPNDPNATVQKMQVVKRAAMAPANPSPQDRAVAAGAAAIEAKARMEMINQKREKLDDEEGDKIRTNKKGNIFENYKKIEKVKSNLIDLVA